MDPLRPFPINQLPSELLVKVFSLVNPNPDPPSWPIIPYWLVLGAVCSQWRDVILNNAVFWRIVDVRERYHPEWLALRLERSKKAPIQVRFQPNIQDLQVSQSLRSLAGHLDHISDLTVFNMLVDLLSSPVITPDPMPILNSLNLAVRSRDPQQIGTYTLPTLDIPDGYLPALRNIGLIGMGIKAPPMVFAGLRVLILEGWNSFAVNNTTSNFLTMLKECVSLEVLIITHVYGTLVVDIEQGAGPVVTLPTVRSVRITEKLPQQIAHLLSHMVLSATIELKLQMTSPILEQTDDQLGFVEDILPDEPFRDRLAILRAFTTLKVQVDSEASDWVNAIEGVVQEENWILGSFVVTVPDTLLATRYIYPYTLQCLQDLFPCGSTLRSLVCIGDIDLVETDVWADELLPHYPRLQSLIVDDQQFGGSMCNLFDALSRVGSAPKTAAGQDPDSVHVKPVCPMLANVFVRNARADLAGLAKVGTCLRTRIAAGVPLRSLTLRLEEPDGQDRAAERHYSAEELARMRDGYRDEIVSLMPGLCDLYILDNKVEADVEYRFSRIWDFVTPW